MRTCPTCGARIVSRQVSDNDIMAALRSRQGMYLYAAGLRDGSANYNSWHLTFGVLSGVEIPISQVKRLLASRRVVEYMEGGDAAYTTVEERRRLDEMMEARTARRRKAS